MKHSLQTIRLKHHAFFNKLSFEENAIFANDDEVNL